MDIADTLSQPASSFLPLLCAIPTARFTRQGEGHSRLSHPCGPPPQGPAGNVLFWRIKSLGRSRAAARDLPIPFVLLPRLLFFDIAFPGKHDGDDGKDQRVDQGDHEGVGGVYYFQGSKTEAPDRAFPVGKHAGHDVQVRTK